jgi:hypothetical protein
VNRDVHTNDDRRRGIPLRATPCRPPGTYLSQQHFSLAKVLAVGAA